MVSLKGRRILVVDDEQEIREILVDILELHDAIVAQAEGAHQALELMKAQSFDTVVSDVRMPEGDGIFLLKSIREADPAKPLVFLATGFSDLTEEEAVALGAVRMIAKPFDLSVLISMLAAASVPN